MSAPGLPEMITLAILALLIFGPERLPGMARTAGKTIANLKREAAATMDEFKQSADMAEIRELAGDLKGQTADLKRAAALTGPIASSASAADMGKLAGEPSTASTVRAALPAPFDPDAT
jgi:sec-independent protein translocase protein TatB